MAYFRNKKSKFGQILEGLAMEDDGIFYNHLVYFTAIWYIYYMVIWYVLPRQIWQPCDRTRRRQKSYDKKKRNFGKQAD
jgi:hypothetical protein